MSDHCSTCCPGLAETNWHTAGRLVGSVINDFVVATMLWYTWAHVVVETFHAAPLTWWQCLCVCITLRAFYPVRFRVRKAP